MNYAESIRYLERALQFGVNPSLDKIEAVCRGLGEPQAAYPSIQVTGTNGKTSTCWFTDSLLRGAGLKVGVYTSPHIHSYRERIRVDGSPIDEAGFAAVMTESFPALEKTKARLGELTEFEILTALALQHFRKAGVDCAVLEVGMGGRWDATSVVAPAVSVITNVSVEHADRLGKDVRRIAWDKSHIIKEGSAAVLGEIEEEGLTPILERCVRLGVEPRMFGRDFDLLENKAINGKRAAIAQGVFDTYEFDVLSGDSRQAVNTTLGIVAAETVTGKALGRQSLEAISLTLCPGRFEMARNSPPVILDGAHNPVGIAGLLEALKANYPSNNLVFLVGLSSDKDAPQILDRISQVASFVFLTESPSYRRRPAGELGSMLEKNGFNRFEVVPESRAALRSALSRLKSEDVLCVTGSIYLISEVRAALKAGKAAGVTPG